MLFRIFLFFTFYRLHSILVFIFMFALGTFIVEIVVCFKNLKKKNRINKNTVYLILYKKYVFTFTITRRTYIRFQHIYSDAIMFGNKQNRRDLEAEK